MPYAPLSNPAVAGPPRVPETGRDRPPGGRTPGAAASAHPILVPEES